MKRVHFNFSKSLSRRALLKGAGVSMALPWLEAMTPAFAASEASQPARSFVSVSLSLGLHGPNLNPVEAGRNYTPSLYLSSIKDVLPDLTIISGSSHPGVSGGHKAEGSILSAAPYSRSAVFKTPSPSINSSPSSLATKPASPRSSSTSPAPPAHPTPRTEA